MYRKISYYARRAFWTFGGVSTRLIGDPDGRCSSFYKNVDSLNAVLDRPIKVHIDALNREQEREVRLLILGIKGHFDDVDFVSGTQADCVITVGAGWHTLIESRIPGYTNTWDIGRLPFSARLYGLTADELSGVDLFDSKENSVSDRPSTTRPVDKLREAARNSEHPMDELLGSGRGRGDSSNEGDEQ